MEIQLTRSTLTLQDNNWMNKTNSIQLTRTVSVKPIHSRCGVYEIHSNKQSKGNENRASEQHALGASVKHQAGPSTLEIACLKSASMNIKWAILTGIYNISAMQPSVICTVYMASQLRDFSPSLYENNYISQMPSRPWRSRGVHYILFGPVGKRGCEGEEQMTKSMNLNPRLMPDSTFTSS